ncbi:hypothetical protein JVX92_10735 [Microbacterium hominis]|uniref:hypothetical protein n=1 Tax=Microbacterium hominis TaxID=162426 RepID=UPI0019644972|nr:hypothetical protein [Microbacterium hominis]QRY39990.1 hypothetical protein JVX92_10735 [Microbacterium hominis]
MTDTLTDTDYTVLNAVALKKMATAAQIAAATDVAEADARAALDRLAAQGTLVMVGDAALPSDDATEQLGRAASDRYAVLREEPEVHEMAERFEVVNTQFLQTISAWQLVEVGGKKVANDHSDADYDGKILDRLDKLVARLSRLIEVLEARDPRFNAYVRRFADAGDAVNRGDIDLVSSPVRDSIHNVWFEFHEDLLRTLGRARKE